MVSFVHVNMHGQVTLPVATRKKHGIKAGSTLSVVDKGSEIVLKKARLIEPSEQKALDDLEKLMDARGITTADIVKSVRKIRKQIYREEYGDD